MHSVGWLAYWGLWLEEWKDFVKPLASLKDQLDVLIVTTDDISVHMPNKSKRKASTVEHVNIDEESVVNLHQRKKNWASSQT